MVKTVGHYRREGRQVIALRPNSTQTIGVEQVTSLRSHAAEIAVGARFTFGKNWQQFLRRLTEDRIDDAERSLCRMLQVSDLSGKRFLDAGSGSGLFSLAARRLGARVRSFDYDPASVWCTRELRGRYYPDDPEWVVEEGSILDEAYVASLGTYDVVYSWGVLHHTGALWRALASVETLVRPGGLLSIAIYNDQRFITRYWTWVKRHYNQSRAAKVFITMVHAPYLLGVPWLLSAIIRRTKQGRGMSGWTDMLDWLGGYPFETARPEDIVEFYRPKGLILQKMTTCGGRHGCNEFVFLKLTHLDARGSV